MKRRNFLKAIIAIPGLAAIAPKIAEAQPLTGTAIKHMEIGRIDGFRFIESPVLAGSRTGAIVDPVMNELLRQQVKIARRQMEATTKVKFRRHLALR